MYMNLEKIKERAAARTVSYVAPKNSMMLWRDPEADIRVVASGCLSPSNNTKTGDMLQIASLVDSVGPTEAIKQKIDSIVCFTCALARTVCYVNPVFLLAIWKATNNQEPIGGFPRVLKHVRFGSYGEIAGVLPLNIMKEWIAYLQENKLKWTGYTHRWMDLGVSPWSQWIMASIDAITAAKLNMTVIQLKEWANSMGWATYRVLDKEEVEDLVEGDILPDEILCPYFTHKVQCADCGLCNGKRLPIWSRLLQIFKPNKRKNIVALLGGAKNKRKAYTKTAVTA